MYSVENFMGFLRNNHSKLTKETKDNQENSRYMQDFAFCFNGIYGRNHGLQIGQVIQELFDGDEDYYFVNEEYWNLLQKWPYSPIIGRLLRVGDSLVAIRPTDACVSETPEEPGDLLIEIMNPPMAKELVDGDRLDMHTGLYEYEFIGHSSVRIYVNLENSEKAVFLNQWDVIFCKNCESIGTIIQTYDNFGLNGEHPPILVEREIQWINYCREQYKEPLSSSSARWKRFVNQLKSKYSHLEFLFKNIEDLYEQLEKQELRWDGYTEADRLNLFAEEADTELHSLVRALFMRDHQGYCLIAVPTTEKGFPPYYAVYQPFNSLPNCAVI
jgi:hypothetical protein